MGPNSLAWNGREQYPLWQVAGGDAPQLDVSSGRATYKPSFGVAAEAVPRNLTNVFGTVSGTCPAQTRQTSGSFRFAAQPWEALRSFQVSLRLWFTKELRSVPRAQGPKQKGTDGNAGLGLLEILASVLCSGVACCRIYYWRCLCSTVQPLTLKKRNIPKQLNCFQNIGIL